MRFKPSCYCIRIVDDDEALLKAMSRTLCLAGWQVRTYASAEMFLQSDDPSMPGCLVLDVQMPGMSGTKLQAKLNEDGVFLPIIFLTAFANVNLTIHAFRQGACDFLTKPVDPDELEAALIKAVERDEAIRSELLQHAPSVRFGQLTAREQEIAPLVAQRLTSAVIGERLGISPRTVERHRASIQRKLDASTAEELQAFLDALLEERSIPPHASIK